jgi:hypothetical protein
VITGTGFEPGATVTMGDPATDIVVVGPTLIRAVAPPRPPGAVDVIVTNPGGPSGALAGAYTYVPVSVTSVSPSDGFPGASVTIVGTGFLAGAAVTFGGAAAQVVSVTAASIRVTVPQHDDGVVDIGATNPDGQGDTLPGAFTIQAVRLIASPASVAPGGQVQLSWTASGGRSSLDWVGLFRVGDRNEDYGWWEYTADTATGALLVSVPATAGQYEFRYLLNDGYVDVARSNTITVSAAGS